MSSPDRIRDADARRRQAMIAVDLDVLEDLLADDLIWTHSSGMSESKTQFLAAIASADVVYETLRVEADQLRQFENVWVHNGVLRGRASRAGQVKDLQARFLAVWHERKTGVQLVA